MSGAVVAPVARAEPSSVPPRLAVGKNTNPVDWTVIADILNSKQGKVPFRKGQADMPDGTPGFGYEHVKAAHAFPGMGLIQQALTGGECTQEYLGRWKCTSNEVEVVYDVTVDPSSRDGLPVGLITAYYKTPCEC